MNYIADKLLAALILQLRAVTEIDVCTMVDEKQAYPYVYISDIYQTEDGPKDRRHYNVELLVQIVYKDQTSPATLMQKMANVCAVFDNDNRFIIANSYEQIQKVEFISASNETISTDAGMLSIGLVRAKYLLI